MPTIPKSWKQKIADAAQIFCFRQSDFEKLVANITGVPVDAAVPQQRATARLKFTDSKSARDVGNLLNYWLSTVAKQKGSARSFYGVVRSDRIAFARNDKGLFPLPQLYSHLWEIKKIVDTTGRTLTAAAQQQRQQPQRTMRHKAYRAFIEQYLKDIRAGETITSALNPAVRKRAR